jgi:predicted kinase
MTVKKKKRMNKNILRRIYEIMDTWNLTFIEAVKAEREDRRRYFVPV